MRLALPILFIVGCKGGSPTGSDISFTFKSASVPDAVVADMPAEAVDAWDGTVGLIAVTDLMLADPLVQGLIAEPAMPEPFCWFPFAPNSVSVSLDYQACQEIGASGTASVERLAQGSAVAFRPTNTFNYNDRSFSTGELVFTPTGSNRWLASAGLWTDVAVPPSATVGVSVDSRVVTLDVQGRAFFNGIANSFNHWGVVTATGDAGTQELWYGATSLEEATAEARPDSALDDRLTDDCRCPTTGTWAIPTTLTAATVDLDLNRSLEDGGTVWPTIQIETTATVDGVVNIRPGNQCGRLQGDFVPDAGSALVITGAELQAGIELACSANTFGDEAKCEQMRAAAANVTEHEITLGDRVNGEMVKEMTERLMDARFCD